MPDITTILLCLFGIWSLLYCITQIMSIPYVQKDDDDEKINFLKEYNEKKKGMSKNEKRVQDSVE